MIELSESDAIRLRLAAQGLSQPLGLSVSGFLERSIAQQGQDLPAVLSALAIRTGFEIAQVKAAFDSGEVVRGWPMRSTLFATTPQHLADVLSLTRHRLSNELARRRRQIELSESDLETARTVTVAATKERGVTRAELVAAFTDAGLEIKTGHPYHLVFAMSHEGLVHWGRFRGKEQELEATVVGPSSDSPEEKLVRICAGYLAGRAPAPIDDIAWFTKLPKTDIRGAVAVLVAAGDLCEVSVAGRTMLVRPDALDGLGGLPGLDDQVLLLPMFDEWYLGYGDRDLISSRSAAAGIVFSKNGMFRPLVVLGGYVVGTWGFKGTGSVRRAVMTASIAELNGKQSLSIQAALDRVHA